MEQKTLTYEIREELTKGAARRLRSAGKIPAVVYGAKEPVAIAIDAREFGQKFANISESTLITLKGKDEKIVLVKDYQENVILGDITHLDFFEVQKGKKLHASVGVHLEGTAKGIKEGGIIDAGIHEVEVECLPKDLPESVIVDVTELGVGDSIHVSDIKAPKGVKFITSGEAVIVSVTGKVAEVSTGDEEEATEEEASEE